MENYRSSSHTRFDIKFHFVWTTKYRKSVLTGQVAILLRELVHEVDINPVFRVEDPD